MQANVVPAAPSATLECGRVLEYETGTSLPAPGELVPCLRHGYCRTGAVHSGRGRVGGLRRRSPRRTEQELADWMTAQRTATLAALRRHRFTLRLVVAGQRAGWLLVDEISGRVTVMPGCDPARAGVSATSPPVPPR